MCVWSAVCGYHYRSVWAYGSMCSELFRVALASFKVLWIRLWGLVYTLCAGTLVFREVVAAPRLAPSVSVLSLRVFSVAVVWCQPARYL